MKKQASVLSSDNYFLFISWNKIQGYPWSPPAATSLNIFAETNADIIWMLFCTWWNPTIYSYYTENNLGGGNRKSNPQYSLPILLTQWPLSQSPCGLYSHPQETTPNRSREGGTETEVGNWIISGALLYFVILLSGCPSELEEHRWMKRSSPYGGGR